MADATPLPKASGGWESKMLITGSCFCGSVSYAVSAQLENARSCHCSRCRKVFGGAASAYAEVQSGSFEWVAGRESVKFYAAGPDWGLAFCDNCGSGLYSASPGDDPKAQNIRMGTVTQRDQFPPQFQVWYRSAQPWLPEIETAKKLDRQ
jgi:hypothetical protein